MFEAGSENICKSSSLPEAQLSYKAQLCCKAPLSRRAAAFSASNRLRICQWVLEPEARCLVYVSREHMQTVRVDLGFSTSKLGSAFFQSGALFLSICYILEQKPVLCSILELKFAICSVHRFFHGFSRFFHGVHWYTQSVHRCSILFIEFSMGSIDFSMVVSPSRPESSAR